MHKSNVGNIGYTFQNYFPGHGYFQGGVVAIKDICTDGKYRCVVYSDGDSNDMSLDEIKNVQKHPKTCTSQQDDPNEKLPLISP